MTCERKEERLPANRSGAGKFRSVEGAPNAIGMEPESFVLRNEEDEDGLQLVFF